MRRDALELHRFYRTRQGRLAQTVINRRLDAIWPDNRGLDILGIGFTTPYMRHFCEDARRCISFMPAGQGAVVPAHGAAKVALGDETHLPFPEALFDRVLLIHALEEAEALPALLRETWRVLAPEGRIVIVAAARAGLWAWMDSTPFGHGRPFSRGQLARLLDDAMFEPTAWSRALYAPPWGWSTRPKVASFWEKAGEKVWPGLGGLLMVQAIKRTAAVMPRPRAALVSRPALEAGRQPALSPRATGQDKADP